MKSTCYRYESKKDRYEATICAIMKTFGFNRTQAVGTDIPGMGQGYTGIQTYL